MPGLHGRTSPPRSTFSGPLSGLFAGPLPALLLALLVTALLLVPGAAAGPVPGVALAAPTCVEPGKVSVPVPWAQTSLGFQRAWPMATGAGITVAVLDSGVDATHPQLSGHVAAGAVFLPGAGTRGDTDCVGHGTAVASVICAQPAKDTGFVGVAPDARILPVTVSEKIGVTDKEQGDAASPAQFAAALRWAVQQGATVVNMSVVYYTDYPEIRDAVKFAVSNDVVLVAAVGNLGESKNKNPKPYPAAYDDVIGVAAVNQSGTINGFSGHGSYVDLVAPGSGVTAARRSKGHASYDGTSVAAPFVAGAAALVRQYWPKLTAEQVADRLMATASPTAGAVNDEQYGHGLVDPYRAVTERIGALPPVAQPPLVNPQVDQAALAAEREQRRLTRWATIIAGLAAALALVIVVAAVIWRKGRRNGWRPVRAPEIPPRPDSTGLAPVGLFDDAPG